MTTGKGKEGDWDCGSCHTRNYVFRSLYNRYKQPRILVDTNTPAHSKWLPASATGSAPCKKCNVPLPSVVSSVDTSIVPDMFSIIDDKPKESNPEPDAQLSSIGGFKEFSLMERLGEGKKPTAIIGEVADDLNLEDVVLSMEAIHSKRLDAKSIGRVHSLPCLTFASQTVKM